MHFSDYEKVNDKWIIQLFPKQDILSCLLLKNPNNSYEGLHKKALLLYFFADKKKLFGSLSVNLSPLTQYL